MHLGCGAAVLTSLLSPPFQAFGSNNPECPDSCLSGQFALVIDVHQMFIDGPHVLLKQLRHQRLLEPERLTFKPALNTRLPVLGLVEDEEGMGRRNEIH